MCRQSRLTAKYQSNSKDLMFGIISQTLASLTLAKADSFFELLFNVGRQMGIRWGESNVQLNIVIQWVCFVHTRSWPLTNMCVEVAANFILPLLSCAADNRTLFLNFPLFTASESKKIGVDLAVLPKSGQSWLQIIKYCHITLKQPTDLKSFKNEFYVLTLHRFLESILKPPERFQWCKKEIEPNISKQHRLYYECMKCRDKCPQCDMHQTVPIKHPHPSREELQVICGSFDNWFYWYATFVQRSIYSNFISLCSWK